MPDGSIGGRYRRRRAVARINAVYGPHTFVRIFRFIVRKKHTLTTHYSTCRMSIPLKSTHSQATSTAQRATTRGSSAAARAGQKGSTRTLQPGAGKVRPSSLSFERTIPTAQLDADHPYSSPVASLPLSLSRSCSLVDGSSLFDNTSLLLVHLYLSPSHPGMSLFC